MGHKKINELAIYSLPPEMFVFFKRNLNQIRDEAVNPDQRRYVVVGEAARHYIDLDEYPDSLHQQMQFWTLEEAKNHIGEDKLMAHGIVPWSVLITTHRLTEAFKRQDASRIISLAADLGHYVGDAHVPLHTTSNYNGQRTNQVGIHGLWESRLPELFINNYQLFTKKARYENNPRSKIWTTIFKAHAALDSVFRFETFASDSLHQDKKFAHEDRNGIFIKTYSREFSTLYHQMLNRQVEKQMKAAIQMTGDLWFTAWVDAGQPDLTQLKTTKKYEEKSKIKGFFLRLTNVRKEADDD